VTQGCRIRRDRSGEWRYRHSIRREYAADSVESCANDEINSENVKSSVQNAGTGTRYRGSDARTVGTGCLSLGLLIFWADL